MGSGYKLNACKSSGGREELEGNDLDYYGWTTVTVNDLCSRMTFICCTVLIGNSIICEFEIKSKVRKTKYDFLHESLKHLIPDVKLRRKYEQLIIHTIVICMLLIQRR